MRFAVLLKTMSPTFRFSQLFCGNLPTIDTEKMQNYLDQLNDVQRAAVQATQGPCLIVAGAGSGKTRVLTYRIAHLLANGVKPWNILALTFTNKAAREMQSRIESLVAGSDAQSLVMGTFHSIFSHILRMESACLGFPSSYTIYDTTDSKSLIKSIIKEMRLDDKVYKPNHIANRISMAKNNLVTPDTYKASSELMATDNANRMPLIATIYERYVARCRQASAMDFDDLLLNTNILFRDNPAVLDKYQQRFKYILVDEYQDTNYAQYLIIKKLAQQHQNICVVGDDAQSIYSFRGAKIENILNFRNDYPQCRLFKLEQNYRSTQNIVSAANSLIKKNEHQIPKDVFSEKDEGDPVRVMAAMTDIEESYNVVGDIFAKIANKHCHYSDFAILYRTNAQSRTFEEALRKRNFPYKIYGGQSFYQRKEVKDAIAYMRLIVNNNDDEALRRVINYPARGIGETTVDKISATANANNCSMWTVATNPELLAVAGLNRGTVAKVAGFTELIGKFIPMLDKVDAYDMAREIIDTVGIKNEYQNSDDPDDQSRLENIEELLRGISDYVAANYKEGESPRLVGFLENVALITDQDNRKTESMDSITLMTIHSAKGLEFPYVYIVGVEEGLFPSSMSVYSQHELEEERRLFYVALTRAMQQVTVSYCRSRAKYGGAREQVTPSRFIKDIDPQYMTVVSGAVGGAQRATFGSSSFVSSSFGQTKIPTGASFAAQRRLQQLRGQSSQPSGIQPSPIDSIRPGVTVLHQQFGQGKVLRMDDNADSRAAIIFFPKAGEKKLLLKFAKLQVVD